MARKRKDKTNKTDEIYEVEKILDKKTEIVDGEKVLKFLVKWKNYGNNHNSWEPEENLSSCKDMIDDYNADESDEDEGMSVLGKTPSKTLVVSGSGLSTRSVASTSKPSNATPSTARGAGSRVQKQKTVNAKKKVSKIAEMIIGAKKSARTNKVSLLVKYHGSTGTSWMPLELAKEQHPNVVFDYYETILDFPSINFSKIIPPQANMEDEDVEDEEEEEVDPSDAA